MRVVYILGTGRSGSTVLDAALGGHPDAVSVGELERLDRHGWSGKKQCACGQESTDCGFWREVTSRWRETAGIPVEEYTRLKEYFEHRGRVAWMSKGERLGADFGRYSTALTALYGAIADVAGVGTVVDSSKRAIRAMALLRMTELDVTCVRLVRDPRAFAWSQQKRASSSALGSVRRWWTANLTGGWVAWKSARSVRVLYEDFAKNPADTLERIGDLAGLDPSYWRAWFSGGPSVEFGHQIGGNRVRLRRKVELRFDEAWKEGMPGRRQAWITLATLPWLLHFGIPLRAR